MTLNFFIGLLVATAYAQSPTPLEYLHLNAAPAVLIEIARAESGFNQYKADGSLLCDGVTGTHCGLFQLSSEHKKNAAKLGIDTNTPQGNIAYALLLYQKEGTRPWNASFNDPSNPNSWGKHFLKSGQPVPSDSPAP